MKGQRVSWQQTVLTADETVGPALEELVLIHVLGLVDSRPVFPANSFPNSFQLSAQLSLSVEKKNIRPQG
jgi:hypothetical protein